MINISISWAGKCENFSCKENQSDFYENIAKVITDIEAPNTVDVASNVGDIQYQIIKKNGSRFIKENYNSVHFSAIDTYPTKFLVCINPEFNNYKFYKLEQLASTLKVTYGRLGAGKNDIFGERTYSYDIGMYWIKFYEKISKGYQDKSQFYLGDLVQKNDNNDAKPSLKSATSPAAILFSHLYHKAKVMVDEICVSSNITKEMVAESKRLLDILYKATDIDDFNKHLLELLTVCPRKVCSLNCLLARSSDDFSRIVKREEDLVDAMETLYKGKTVVTQDNSYFENLGIEVYFATDKQKEIVMGKLTPTLQSRVKNVYRVIPNAQQKKFNEYLKKNKIIEVKQLWHGSRTENWLSIISNGLLLKPNAKITGKMFGDGIYFAPSCEKSFKYTDGGYWAGGTKSGSVFMGLYATAYGNPLDVTSSCRYSQASLKNLGKNCVHAHAGVSLLHDEIIYYDESAMVLNYVVEFD